MRLRELLRPLPARAQRLATLTLRLGLALAMAGALSACGNDLQTNIQTALPDTYAPADPLQGGFSNGKDPVTGDTESNVQNYACPTANNVVPDYDWELNGTGFYTVCPARANTTDILVHGTPAVGSAVCIFPANAADPLDVAVPRDASTNLPVFQCVQVTASGAYATFAATLTYNAAYIVDLQDATQMQSCLAQANYYLCPHDYSFGLFRNYTAPTQ